MSLEEEHAYADRLPCPRCGHQPVVEKDGPYWQAWCPIHMETGLAEGSTQLVAIKRWNKLAEAKS